MSRNSFRHSTQTDFSFIHLQTPRQFVSSINCNGVPEDNEINMIDKPSRAEIIQPVLVRLSLNKKQTQSFFRWFICFCHFFYGASIQRWLCFTFKKICTKVLKDRLSDLSSDLSSRSRNICAIGNPIVTWIVFFPNHID